MSYKSQLFPLSSTRETPLRRKIDRSWGSPPANLRNTTLQERDLRNMKLLRSWLVYDSVSGAGLARRVNWNSVLGLGLATVVSASIWAGIGLMIASVWK